MASPMLLRKRNLTTLILGEQSTSLLLAECIYIHALAQGPLHKLIANL